jgi:hypothetical protein
MNYYDVPHIGKGVTSCEPYSGFAGALWNLDMDVFWQATQMLNKIGIECKETSGWDRETGIPKEETLIAFGLEDLVNEPGHPCRRH